MNIFIKIKKSILDFFAIKSEKRRESVQMDALLDFLGIDKKNCGSLSEATYFACLKVLSEAVGKLPCKLLRHSDFQGVQTLRDHPLYNVVHDRPNRYMTATTFWSTMEYNRNHYGNAYALIDGAGRKTQLWILPSRDVEIWYDDSTILGEIPDIYYLYSVGGKIYKFGSEEILHFKSSNTFDGITGVSVRQQLQTTISGGIKAQKMLNKMYESGFTAKAVLQYTSSLSDENAKKFTAGIEAYAKGELAGSGVENIIPIPLGATLTPLNVKLADNEFLGIKQYTSLQIASAFGIKPYQIGDYTKSSYASAEAQQLSFYIDTLLYILKQDEEELNYKLLSTAEISEGVIFKFNIDAILRADYTTKINTLATAVNSFLMTPNEARSKLDLCSKPGGDKLLGNGGSIPVEFTGAQYVASDGTNPVDDTKNQKGG